MFYMSKLSPPLPRLWLCSCIIAARFLHNKKYLPLKWSAATCASVILPTFLSLNLSKIQPQNLDQNLSSKSWSKFSIKILTKLISFNLDHISAARMVLQEESCSKDDFGCQVNCWRFCLNKDDPPNEMVTCNSRIFTRQGHNSRVSTREHCDGVTRQGSDWTWVR